LQIAAEEMAFLDAFGALRGLTPVCSLWDANVLTGWTALMVTGLARAARVCQGPD
jgi:hypothetical protein